ncbi:MAG: pyridoxine 5'-phosphate synthase [Myxococcota bacterium]|nr:pyridoxine 5'-phosphate synthase [Myxococcota bacterium]
MTRRRLGVSLEHIGSLRQVARAREPDPVATAALAEAAGASQIKVHLREDRRHIQERDVRLLRETVTTSLNLQMAPTMEMLKAAYDLKPDEVTLVPERSEELATETGLDVHHHRDHLKKYIGNLRDSDIGVFLYIDPEVEQVRAAHRLDAKCIEVSTLKYTQARALPERRWELQRLVDATRTAVKLGMRVSVGGRLDFQSVPELVPLEGIAQFNMGHALVARSVITGMERAVRDAVELLHR